MKWKITTGTSVGYVRPGGHPVEKYNRMKGISSSILERVTASGAVFLVHKSIKSAMLGCQPISSRIITIRLRAKPLNITIIQVYAPTTDYDDEHMGQFYNQIQAVIDKVNKKDTLIIQGYWNSNYGIDAVEDWAAYCGPSSNDITNLTLPSLTRV